jgi:hypothetical protein
MLILLANPSLFFRQVSASRIRHEPLGPDFFNLFGGKGRNYLHLTSRRSAFDPELDPARFKEW